MADAPSFLIADDHPMVRDALASALGQAFSGAAIAMAGTLRRGPGRAGARARDRRPAARPRHAGHGRPDRPGAAALGSSGGADHRRVGGARACRRPPRLRIRRLGLHRQVGLAGGDRAHRARRAGRRDLRAARGDARRFLRPARRAAHAAAMARARPDGAGRPEQADRPQARRRRGHGEGACDGDPAQARRALAHPGGDRGARPRLPHPSRPGLNAGGAPLHGASWSSTAGSALMVTAAELAVQTGCAPLEWRVQRQAVSRPAAVQRAGAAGRAARRASPACAAARPDAPAPAAAASDRDRR